MEGETVYFEKTKIRANTQRLATSSSSSPASTDADASFTSLIVTVSRA